jgi:hypothetical protein
MQCTRLGGKAPPDLKGSLETGRKLQAKWDLQRGLRRASAVSGEEFAAPARFRATAASPIRGEGADRFQYELTIEGPDGRHELAMSEDSIPADLRPLIERVRLS